MRWNVRNGWLLAALAAVLVWALMRTPGTEADRTVLEGSTMGTTYRVVIGAPLSRDSTPQLKRQIDSLLADVNASMSTYDTDSELSRFNARQDTGAVEISPALATVVAAALQVHAQSGGAFDVTIAPLVDAWGFGPTAPPVQPLDSARVRELLAYVGSDKLALRGAMLAKRNPRVQLDLSAIAKGYGVDIVSVWLSSRGYIDHLVEIGGEVRASGHRPDGSAFRVGIEAPEDSVRRVQRAVLLEGVSLASSGNYRNYFTLGGERYVHTLDPVTGYPVRHRLLAVSVLHPSCMMADAWATALMAAGPERAQALVQAWGAPAGFEALLLIDAGDGQITEWATPGFRARFAPVVAPTVR